MKRKLRNKASKQSTYDFLGELRNRRDEGYSMRQLIKSHIPAIGDEAKISSAQITAAMRQREKHEMAPQHVGSQVMNLFMASPAYRPAGPSHEG